MIGEFVRIFFTFGEKFRRTQIQRYCWECEKKIPEGKGLTLWCGARCKRKTTARESHGIGKIYHRPYQ